MYYSKAAILTLFLALNFVICVCPQIYTTLQNSEKLSADIIHLRKVQQWSIVAMTVSYTQILFLVNLILLFHSSPMPILYLTKSFCIDIQFSKAAAIDQLFFLLHFPQSMEDCKLSNLTDRATTLHPHMSNLSFL